MARKRSDKEFTNSSYNPFSAKTPKQKELFQALSKYPIVIARGPAGTGKTAVITSYAAQQLHEGKIAKIVVTRPAVEAAGESLGFLPGELEQKFSPYLRPLQGIFEEVLGKATYEMYVKSGKIEPIPMAYMRGATFKDAIVIADEVQGTTPEQMEMLMTRMGENAQLFCAGDEEQSDIRGDNGLVVACKYLEWMMECKIVTFELDEIVRSNILSDIIQSFRKYKTQR